MKRLCVLSLVLIIVLTFGLLTGAVSCRSIPLTAQAQEPQKVVVDVNINVQKDGSVTVESTTATVEETTSTETTGTKETATTKTTTKLEGTLPDFYETEGGVPAVGGRWSADVTWEEIEEVTGGYAQILDKLLPGGANPDVGFLIELLAPGKETYTYTISNPYPDDPNLQENWPAQIWHGNRLLNRTPTETDWKLAINKGLARCYKAPNGTNGKGMDIVHVLVIKGDQILFERIFNKGEFLEI